MVGSLHPVFVPLLAAGREEALRPLLVQLVVIMLAARAGAPIVIVNGSPTEQDHLATAIARGPISSLLPSIVTG